MNCLNCGAELEEKTSVCPHCGHMIDEVFHVTYEDSSEYVEDPIIIESHTFTDDERLQVELQKKLKEDSKKQTTSKTLPVLSIVFVFILLCNFGCFGFVFIYPMVLSGTYVPQARVITKDDLSSGLFSINQNSYSLMSTYKDFKKNGWSIDSTYIEDGNAVVLGRKEKSTVEYSFSHSSIDEGNIYAFFYNSKDESLPIYDCSIYGISVSISNDDNLSFTLPKKIHEHSSLEEIVRAYGEVDENHITSFTDEGYVVYRYEEENKYLLDLTIYDDGGLMTFHYEVA